MSPTYTSSHQDPRARLAEFDYEIEILKSSARGMVEGLARRRVIDPFDFVVYPVLTLPTEITGVIFSHFVDDPHIGCTTRPGRGPQLLGGVCKQWREICLSMSSLWTSLRVYNRIDRGIDSLVDALQCWLSRAGNCPIDLEIDGALTAQCGILEVLGQFAFQLRSLDVSTPLPENLIQDHIPRLQRLVLRDKNAETAIVAFHDAPRLREVELSIQNVSFPWTQLTHLALQLGSLPRALEILQCTPHLQVLTLDLVQRQGGREVLALRRLATDAAFVPRLRALTIRALDRGTPVYAGAFVEMVAERWSRCGALAADGVRRLESVTLLCMRGMAQPADLEVIAERLRPLVDEGLDLVLGIM